MRAHPLLFGVGAIFAIVLAACIPTRMTYYEPTAGAEGRNTTLCTLGVRDQSEVKVGPGVRVRISGADPRTQTATLSAAVELLVYEGHRVQFASDTFTISTEAPEQEFHVTLQAITTSCYGKPPTCSERLAATDVLEGSTSRGSGLIPGKLPRVFELLLVASAPAPDTFTVQVPPLLVDSEPVTLPAVRFQKVTKTTVEGFCQ